MIDDEPTLRPAFTHRRTGFVGAKALHAPAIVNQQRRAPRIHDDSRRTFGIFSLLSGFYHFRVYLSTRLIINHGAFALIISLNDALRSLHAILTIPAG
jgi:hypothetical protein